MHRRFQVLLTAGEVSPQRVLALFYALMARSAGVPEDPA
jgi:hypothetical protein